MKRVAFQGSVYWFDGELLSPLRHFNEAGDYIGGPDEVAFAIVRGTVVFRFNQPIGMVRDFRDVIDTEPTALPDSNTDPLTKKENLKT